MFTNALPTLRGQRFSPMAAWGQTELWHTLVPSSRSSEDLDPWVRVCSWEDPYHEWGLNLSLTFHSQSEIRLIWTLASVWAGEHQNCLHCCFASSQGPASSKWRREENEHLAYRVLSQPRPMESESWECSEDDPLCYLHLLISIIITRSSIIMTLPWSTTFPIMTKFSCENEIFLFFAVLWITC
jgi:hypothetical protein